MIEVSADTGRQLLNPMHIVKVREGDTLDNVYITMVDGTTIHVPGMNFAHIKNAMYWAIHDQGKAYQDGMNVARGSPHM